MSYCKIGDGAKVTYQFAKDQPIIYQSDATPIDVVTGTISPDGTTANYNPVGYQISFPSPQAFAGTFTAIVLDYKTRPGNIGTFFEPQQGLFVSFINCDATTFGTLEVSCSGAIVVNNAIHCPSVAASDEQCRITISKDGNQLFQAKGNCPVTFTVACGDECPNGYCKIDCETYPGYCCISEAEIQSLINIST